ncbi:hypothetical protein VTK73DRAFT_6774 [Phialemonium thermophilum]|uniref:Prefoldin subunit n=1 Tax=Phialemonium thermophilum TaxID=223376 RepID=A0ABR3Y871_9PEZI
MFSARRASLNGVAKGGWLLSNVCLPPNAGLRNRVLLVNWSRGSCRDASQAVHQIEERSVPCSERYSPSLTRRHELESPLPPRQLRSLKYHKFSPSSVLWTCVQRRKSPLSQEQWAALKEIAASQSLRLPVLTAQFLMMRDETLSNTGLLDILKNNGWDKRVSLVKSRGITEDDIAVWAWILTGPTPDARLERFLGTDKHRPIFLLLAVVRQEQTFVNRSFFVALVEYVSRVYCRKSSVEETQSQSLPRQMAMDDRLNMTPDRFIMLLKRLAHHCLRLWPDLLESLARLVVAYISSVESESVGRAGTRSPRKAVAAPQIGYALRCRVFNQALRLLGKPASLNPVANSKYNWEAQKLLLSYSSNLKRQLIFSEASYWVIRSVLLGLEKSRSEEKVAIRSKKTWPPYRQAWDGLDERRRQEDDWSRSVKAGVLAREAGYPETAYDRALSALGGAVLGQSPTVQTRSTEPKLWTGSRASYNIFTMWAAQVKATRTRQEAWKIFESPPQPGLKPNHQVYGEMFEKLVAAEVADPTSAVPGNSREVFPAYDTNLSAVEKARVQPPSVKELYDRMLHSGIRPVGKCLVLLVGNSHSEEVAKQYLLDSPLRSVASALWDPAPDGPSPQDLDQIPLPVFNAYITLLCKVHAEQYLKPGSRDLLLHPDSYIRRAIRLASIRLRGSTREGRTYKAPWHSILRALAMTRTLFVSFNFKQNHVHTLATCLDIFRTAKRLAGLDVVLLELLSFAITRTMSALFAESPYPEFKQLPNKSYRIAASADDMAHIREFARDTLQDAHATLRQTFREIASPQSSDERERGAGLSGTQLRAAQIYLYLQCLGQYGDVEEMASVMKWLIHNLEDDRFLDSARVAGSKEHSCLISILRYFCGFSVTRLPRELMQDFEDEVERLSDERAVPWVWPEPKTAQTDEDVLVAQEVSSQWLAFSQATNS